MPLQVQMADGTEPPCRKCWEEFKAGDLKVAVPGKGKGKTYVGTTWVHAKAPCDPRRSGKHSSNSNHKRRKSQRRAAAR